MAEVFLVGTVHSILRHLAYLLSPEVRQALCAEKELKKLQSTFRAIEATLQEAAMRKIESDNVKLWLENLKDMVYDTDDLLDDLSTQTLRRRGVTGGGKRARNEVCTFFSSSNQIGYPCVMARRIKGIRERFDAILNDRTLSQLEGKTSTIPQSVVENQVRLETYPFNYTHQVFGREKDKKEIINFLMNPHFEDNVSVLSIVGSGGVGKTTLAKLVFDDEIVKSYFILRLWVCVPEDINVENILRKIVKECTRDMEFANLNMNEMQKRLGEELDEKRFLLVLDDVQNNKYEWWNNNRDEWLTLQGFLTNGAKGSKILMTTRHLHVADTMHPKVHVLSGLDDDSLLSMLMQMAVKEEHEWTGKILELTAKEILRKCGGNPLTMMTLGRILSSMKTEEEWMEFTDQNLSRLYQKEGDILPSLKLGYDVLPTHLKGCFAYCGLFPIDCELDPSELIRLWIAQGYVKSSGNKKTLEELGQEYFEELVSRSFFQHVRKDIFGNIVGCKMHDLIHDLALSVGKDNCICICSSSDLRYNSGARHVSMVDLGDNGLKGYVKNRRIRSLFLTRIKASHLDISRFEYLRVLRVHGNINAISRSIGKLKHMRSLDLSENEMLKSLPDSMSKLYNLETLNLVKCYNLERLPRGITKLVNLRKLDVRGCNKLRHMPRGIGKLTNLQMLHRFVVGKKGNRKAARLHELSRLTGLREGMVIERLERLESISSEADAPFSMEKFALQCLELQWKCVDKEYRVNDEAVLEKLRPHSDLKALGIEGYGGTRLSFWISQLHKLVKINISHCNQCTRLPPMDQLPFLKEISLNELRELEWIEFSKNGTPQHPFFPSLEVLEFKYLVNFKGWERRRGKEEIQDDEVSSSLCMLPTFSDKITLTIEYCQKFSYMHGEKRLHLAGTTSKLLEELWRNSSRAVSDPSVTTFISISSISVSSLTSFSFYEIQDVRHLPVELFPCCQNLRSLIISRCPRLESLCIGAIFRYLVALEILQIRDFPLLDLSIDDGNGGKDMDNVQTHGHCKLHRLTVKGIWKMESLPVWFLYLPNLKSLEISSCFSLKSLPRRLILRLLTTLESLVLKYCPELDLTGESKDQEDNLNLQFFGKTKLQELELCFIQKMKLLPWWIQHLTNLESLRLHNCKNLEGFPHWFPHLISLKSLRVDDCSGLKSLPGKLILQLATTLDSLLLSRCPELDLTEELVDQVDAPNLQFWGPFKLSRLEFGSMEKMQTLPWWVQYLSELENLKLVGCRNLEALPEWFPQLKSLKRLIVLDCGELSTRCKNTKEDWSKISHIQYVYTDQ